MCYWVPREAKKASWLQDAVLVDCVGLRSVHRASQRQGPACATFLQFLAQDATVFLALLLAIHLGADGDPVAFEAHVDVMLADAGELGLHGVAAVEF